MNDNNNCVKQSTKCLFWFGGKLCSVNINQGDPIEKVIKNIIHSLECFKEEFDILELDLGDLIGDKECPPKNIRDVIQALISKVNANVSTNSNSLGSIMVNVAPCHALSFENPEVEIESYVAYLGNVLCSQAEEINNLKESQRILTETVESLNESIQKLIGG